MSSNTSPYLDIIVARYKENIDWLNTISDSIKIRKIFIYDKGSNNYSDHLHSKWSITYLPNVGRESNTYLYHIINHYDSLNSLNLFLQGNPYDHSINFTDQINSITNELVDNIYPLNHVQIETNNSTYRYHNSHPHGLPLPYFMDLLFDVTMDLNQTIKVSYGAQFCVTKLNILSRPIDFYRYLFKLVSRQQDSIEGYVFERLWLYIFDTKMPISNTYKLWI